MTFKAHYHNHRITIDLHEPSTYISDSAHEMLEREAKALAQQIERHCDGVQHISGLQYDTYYQCEECGWATESAPEGKCPECVYQAEHKRQQTTE